MIDTIIAQCTPSGTGALALIRLSGPKALFIASQAAYLSSKKNLSEVATKLQKEGLRIPGNLTVDGTTQLNDDLSVFANTSVSGWVRGGASGQLVNTYVANISTGIMKSDQIER